MSGGVLLDTHALLGILDGDSRVPEWLHDPSVAPLLLVSHASIWEIAIKRSLGRLTVAEDLPEKLDDAGVPWLAIKLTHVWKVSQLPLHHRDPFDRLLIGQALTENLIVATADPEFARYGVPVRWS